MVHEFKNDLGAQLYEEVLQLSLDRNDSKAYEKFSETKIKKVKRVFEKYQYSEVNIQLLYIFLDTYAFHNNLPSIFFKENQLSDVSVTYGYTDLVADKFKDVPVI